MLNWINKKRNQKGFTLVELVVVIAILGILAALAIPRLSKFRENAQTGVDEANAALIYKAYQMYEATSKGVAIDRDKLNDLLDANLQLSADEYSAIVVTRNPETTGPIVSITYKGITYP